MKSIWSKLTKPMVWGMSLLTLLVIGLVIYYRKKPAVQSVVVAAKGVVAKADEITPAAM